MTLTIEEIVYWLALVDRHYDEHRVGDIAARDLKRVLWHERDCFDVARSWRKPDRTAWDGVGWVRREDLIENGLREALFTLWLMRQARRLIQGIAPQPGPTPLQLECAVLRRRLLDHGLNDYVDDYAIALHKLRQK